MTKIGRNTPCPCGSGRKYKACCLGRANASDFQFRLNRRLSSELVPQVIEFASESTEAVSEAWMQFYGSEDIRKMESDSEMNALFMPWFLFNWGLEIEKKGTLEIDEITIAELFLVANAGRLTTDEKDFLFCSIRCPYTFCEARDVRPGVGFTLFDLLRRIQYEVVERTASQTVMNGEIIYCATSELRGFRSNIGTGPYPLRPTSKMHVLKLREWIVNETGSEKIMSEDLLEFEDEIRWLYLDLAAQRLAPPVLLNHDGHRILPQKLYFEIDSANEAFHSLKLLAKRDREKDLLQDADVKNGAVRRVEIPWLGDAKKRGLSETVLLGTLTIDGHKLVIDVNSAERADMIRTIVEEQLGGHAVYKRTLIEPIEAQMREMWQAAGTRGGSSTTIFSSLTGQEKFGSFDEAEIGRIMKDTAREYWEAWLDDPIPALNNMSPREAAKTDPGRDLLESLLLEYENNASNVDNLLTPDIPSLRQKLGLDKKPRHSQPEHGS